MLCYLIFVNTYALKVQSLLCYLSEYRNRSWENQLGQQLVYHMFCVCSYPRNLRNCLISWVQYRDWIKCSKWVTSINQWFSFVGMPTFLCKINLFRIAPFPRLQNASGLYVWFNIQCSLIQQIRLLKFYISFYFNAFISSLWNGNVLTGWDKCSTLNHKTSQPLHLLVWLYHNYLYVYHPR